jgi:hypothetical protein
VTSQYGYRWPASQLTDEDMRRLTIISNMTKIPCTKLLHMAVNVLFDQTRGLMTELLHVHEQTGQALGESLDGFDIRQYLPSPSRNRTSQDYVPHPRSETHHADDEALKHIQRTLRGDDDRNDFARGGELRLETPDQHGRCQHCA